MADWSKTEQAPNNHNCWCQVGWKVCNTLPSKYIFCLGNIICNFQYNSNCKNVIVACSLDKLLLSETSNSSTVDITADLGEYSYYSDILVTLTSRKFNGSFQLEYLPGM